MRVLKFGGTSVANAERFLRVADILRATPGRDRSRPFSLAAGKITNHRVAMIERPLAVRMHFRMISDAERIFAELLQGLAEAMFVFPPAQLKAFVEQEFAQIKHVL